MPPNQPVCPFSVLPVRPVKYDCADAQHLRLLKHKPGIGGREGSKKDGKNQGGLQQANRSRVGKQGQSQHSHCSLSCFQSCDVTATQGNMHSLNTKLTSSHCTLHAIQQAASTQTAQSMLASMQSDDAPETPCNCPDPFLTCPLPRTQLTLAQGQVMSILQPNTCTPLPCAAFRFQG